MICERKPGLFGIEQSNRDFTRYNAWGKNQFNSSFPASLCSYIHSKGMSANYLSVTDGKYGCTNVGIEKVFGIDPTNADTYFAFEAQHSPFQKFVVGCLPRTDVVVQNKRTGECLAGLEVKLTALPDNTTCKLEDSDFGCEIVVRPDTIVYLACSIACGLGKTLGEVVSVIAIDDWSDAREVLPHAQSIIDTLKTISTKLEDTQKPFLLQPVWKTMGKSPKLADYCLDVFVWSDAGFAHFVSEIASGNADANKITRQTRTAIWLYKMLLDIVQFEKFDHELIIDQLSYNTKNDKAFASSGQVTNSFMSCERLTKPLVHKDEIKKIILGGGQTLLSPERRFDAIIYNSPELF
jgi:hypothetical protein